jgi:4-hydroxybenzoyl-CoA thioesterase
MFECVHPIRFNDVDGAGLVYFPRFFHLCHATMEDLFNTRGPVRYADFITLRRRGFPTVHAQADYKAPLRYGDHAHVTLTVDRLGSSSVHFRYTIRREAGGEPCCVARVVTVHTDLDALRPVPLGQDLRDLLEPLLLPAPQGGPA